VDVDRVPLGTSCSAKTVSCVSGRSGHQRQLAAFGRFGHGFLFIARLNADHIRLDPYLQKVRLRPLCVVELAVAHAAARAHALNITRRNAFDIAHAVLVGQVARQHVTDDLHVTMAVGAKAGARGDAVFVDDAQIAPAHMGRVEIVGK